jgi:hypothetical protein
MQLTFLGNTYTRQNDVSAKSLVQLTYRRSVYQANREAVSFTTPRLTYRGVSYLRWAIGPAF